ncbi:MAG: hypothetical protein ACLFR1_07035 [Spirochaetia bacterium]
MKKSLILVVLLLCSALFHIYAADIDELQEIMDFTLTLGDLDEIVQNQEYNQLSMDKFYLIQGSIGSIIVAERDPENFLAEIEIVNGEWVGLDEIRMYRCFVQLAGPDFAERFPIRRSQENENSIQLNQEVFVLVKVIGVAPLEDGGEALVLQGHYVRTLN